MDGANVEIVERVGMENAEIFGLRAEQVDEIVHEKSYNVWDYYHHDEKLKKVIDALVDGTFSEEKEDFRLVYNELMFKNDEYLLLPDFEAYAEAQKHIEARYQDRSGWAKMCLINVAQSGYFSSDRTIQQYADTIWHIQPVDVE